MDRWFRGLTNILSNGVEFLVNHNLLPLINIIIEPAKVLFLNNAINHGVLGPITLEESQRIGKSILFMLESNPGPGLGILLAYWLAGKGSCQILRTGRYYHSLPGWDSGLTSLIS